MVEFIGWVVILRYAWKLLCWCLSIFTLGRRHKEADDRAALITEKGLNYCLSCGNGLVDFDFPIAFYDIRQCLICGIILKPETTWGYTYGCLDSVYMTAKKEADRAWQTKCAK